MWKRCERPDPTPLSEEACAQAPTDAFSQVERGRARGREEAGYCLWNTAPGACQLSGWTAPNTGPWTQQAINRCQLNHSKHPIHIEFLTCAGQFTCWKLVLIAITHWQMDISIFLLHKRQKPRFRQVKKEDQNHTDNPSGIQSASLSSKAWPFSVFQRISLSDIGRPRNEQAKPVLSDIVCGMWGLG